MIREFQAEMLSVRIYGSREEMGYEAARAAGECVRELLDTQREVNVIFAAAASQNEFLEAFSTSKGIAWERVNAFHMDEYAGLPIDHPQRFGNFLDRKIFSRVPFKEIFYLNGSGDDNEEECVRYSRLLKKHPADITFMGIGENTHLAFNDPHVANFNDHALVKIIDLDERCKMQQVGDGCFSAVNEVPPFAFTLTIPALLNAPYIFCIVPGKNKAEAVRHTIREKISERYPSTVLRKHPGAALFLDPDSAGLINE